MLENISYLLIFGKPVMFYLGLLVFISFSITATIGYLFHHGYKIQFKWHPIMVAVSFTLAITHAFLGIAAYF